MKIKDKAPTKSAKTLFLTHDTMPASVGLVKGVRSELKAMIGSVDLRVASVDAKVGSLGKKVDSLDAKIDSVDKKVDSLDAKIDSVRLELKGDIQEVKADIQQVLAGVHKTQVLMEQQRSEDRAVMDGLKTMSDRQNKVEADVEDFRRIIGGLPLPLPKPH